MCKYLCEHNMTQQLRHKLNKLDVRMSLQERYYMREEDVFPATHSVEIACNDNKLSPMMLCHTAQTTTVPPLPNRSRARVQASV